MDDTSRSGAKTNHQLSDAMTYIRNMMSLFLAFLARISSQSDVIILTYHSVGLDGDFLTVDPDAFRRQVDYLRNNYSIVPLSKVVNFVKGKKEMFGRSVSITFDDGYEDFYLYVYPLLRKHNLPATVFVATGYIEKEWPFVQSHPKMLTWDQIKEISNNNIEIGAHTVTHPNLQTKKPEEVAYEIIKSKEEIEKHLKRTVRFFSYPFGRYTNQVLKIVEEAGFEAGVSGVGTVQRGSCIFALNRVQIDRSITFLQFKAHLTKAVDWSRKIEQTARTLLRRHAREV
jgi:peptidoglycan/xylan/chitin deacetylase (PgdA/CDA1 family)